MEPLSNELSAHDLLPPEAGLTLLGCEESEGYWVVRAQGLTRSVCTLYFLRNAIVFAA
jgi:hypothetical protein